MIEFQSSFVEKLPGDTEFDNYPRQVINSCYSFALPKPVENPSLVAFSEDCARLIDIEPESCEDSAFVQIMSGNYIPAGTKPYAMCYGGHQFGNWAGQLGDGRAINFGEIVNRKGKKWSLQLKGAGPTPYSRTADGLAVLRSSIREFLCSEWMHHLGVPTTRALSIVTTGEEVLRDMFYDGNPQFEKGAIVARLSESFIRFGNFELLAARRELETLRKLLIYCINETPELSQLNEDCSFKELNKQSIEFFRSICLKTADLMVQWMQLGFVHGVMNTDNMSIMGQTIDYGPFGWLENYDEFWTPNTTDIPGRRYCYGKQPEVAFWNLYQLANSLRQLDIDEKSLIECLDDYKNRYIKSWQKTFANKLGFKKYLGNKHDLLINSLIDLFKKFGLDWTVFFRKLSLINFDPNKISKKANLKIIASSSYQKTDEGFEHKVNEWLCNYIYQIKSEELSSEERIELMDATNPIYVPRNYLLQEAIEKAQKEDFSLIHQLMQIMQNPYTDQGPSCEQFKNKRPNWALNKPGCSSLSCSS